jgi:hypothetical protein
MKLALDRRRLMSSDEFRKLVDEKKVTFLYSISTIFYYLSFKIETYL